MDLRDVLPHRYPMLLVDRVAELTPGRHLVAHKAITHNEPWYRDAGDDLGYPAVLLIESFAQAAGVLAGSGRPDRGGVMLAGSMSDVDITGTALPGDVLELRVRAVRELSDAVIVAGEGVIAGATVFTVGAMVLAFRPADVLRPVGESGGG